MAKRIDPEVAWAAYSDAHRALRDWLTALPVEYWSRPSALPEWTVAHLAAHMIRVDDSFIALRPAPAGASGHSVWEYISAYGQNAAGIAGVAQEISAESDHQPARILATLDERHAAATAHFDGLGRRELVVATRRMPVRLSDFIVTRVLEVVVHADDFARSVPELSAPKMPPNAEGMTVRALADALAERAPGRTVELRVPPFAAVQCVEGPRHTRGTPPNVIEMSPLVWVRLAAGRSTWADESAAGAVLASGGRADLSGYLPLL